STFEDPVIQPLVEFAWHIYLQEKKTELKGEVWAYASWVMCFIEGRLLGDEKELFRWPYHEGDYGHFKPEALCQAIAEDFYSKYLKNQTSRNFTHVFLLSLLQPFSDPCPRTCEDFQALWSGGAKSLWSLRDLAKRTCTVNSSKGSNTTVVLHPPTFSLDESFSIHQEGRGILGMTNKGRHGNSSRFYIIFQPAPHLDKKYVAQAMTRGMEILQTPQVVPTYNKRPTGACRIINCGTFDP
ncbi:PPIL6 protein, partial [Climacteris rufus]|nr:PPIL6 protein [Climacteris rufus]